MTDRPESAFADPRQPQCPQCGTRVQRTETGTVADGMAAHQLKIHGAGEGASGGR